MAPNPRTTYWTLGVVSASALLSTSVAALNTSTHELINAAAGDTQTLDGYLINTLGLPGGRRTELTGSDGTPRDVLEWLRIGGEREDDGWALNGRFLNHFHNPLKPWSEAGLHVFRHQQSSVQWMQYPNQEPGGNWAWRDARRLYLDALTASDARSRESAAADLFRALGQIMHLVVDASVPEHARDDPHPFGTVARQLLKRRKAGNYEYWVSDQHERAEGQAGSAETEFVARFLARPVGFDTRIFGHAPPPGESVATVPIARLIDADVYTEHAPDPNVTVGGAVGLAEFANANFFSEDTLDGQLPFPRREDLVFSPRLAPSGLGVRGYFSKPAGYGQPTDVALAECVTDRVVGRWIAGRRAPFPCVDEAVWEETARHMLPRAVGYARGVLDYFFRARLRMVRVYSRHDAIYIEIENASDETAEGVFEVYARYEKGTSNERRERVAVLNGGGAISIAPGRYVELPLHLSGAAPTAYYILVFRGRLGLEEEAVASQVFAVPAVQVVQQSYRAEVGRGCVTQTFPTTAFIAKEILTCTWSPVNHQIQGNLMTNFVGADPSDPADPAIVRVEAVWSGRVAGPAPLTIHGVRYPSGVWTRRGDEPDPDHFFIDDPAERRDSVLTVHVRLRDGNGVSTALATLKSTLATAEKYAGVLVRADGSAEWTVTAVRTWRIEPNVNLSGFQIVSVGGYEVPTFKLSDQLSTSPEIWGHIVEVSGFGVGIQRVLDIYEAGFGTPSAALARWSSIVLEPPPFPAPPDLHWTVALRSRPWATQQLRYHRAFFGEPVPVALTISAREASPQ